MLVLQDETVVIPVAKLTNFKKRFPYTLHPKHLPLLLSAFSTGEFVPMEGMSPRNMGISLEQNTSARQVFQH